MASVSEVAARRTHPVYRLEVEVRVPSSGTYVVISVKGEGNSGVPVLVAFEMCKTPVCEDVLCEIETAVVSHLEHVLARMVGLQPLLGVE
jgi:hypothetical protein